MIKSLLLISTLLLATVAPLLGQERQLGVAAVLAHSPGTGHENSAGLQAELILPYRNLRLLAAAGWAHEPKSYLNNGQAWRWSAEGRYQWRPAGNWKPFAGGGLSVTRQTTSEYIKTARFPTVTAGVNYADQYVIYARHYFREVQTQNRVSADEVGLDAYLPFSFSKPTPWRFRYSLAAMNVRFFQPSGVSAGSHSVIALRVSVGVGWAW